MLRPPAGSPPTWAELLALHCSPEGVAMEICVAQAFMYHWSRDCFRG